MGREWPASWLQSVNPIWIILLAPAFGSLWVWLEKRNADPSIPMKAGLGLTGLAVGFFVLAWGAANASPDNLVSPGLAGRDLLPVHGGRALHLAHRALRDHQALARGAGSVR